MRIIDLSEEYEKTYCRCLEDWSPEMAEAGGYKEQWLERKKGQGLRVKLAQNEKGEIVGMIHYAPSAAAPVEAQHLYYVYCVWVHGYKQGVGDNRKRGIGTALLEAAEEDCRELGAKGIAAWGIRLPFFIRSSWFKKRGFVRADSDGMIELVWKKFAEDAVPPRLLRLKKKPAPSTGEAVRVTCLRNGWCPAQNLACERMRRAAADFPGKVSLETIDTDDPAKLREWGTADALYIGDKLVAFGPPPTYVKLRKRLGKAVRKLKP